MPGLNVGSSLDPFAQASRLPTCESDPIASAAPWTPLTQTPAPDRRDGDAAAARRDDGAEPQSRRSLLLIDDVRLRRECLLHLLSAELPDFAIVAATTQSLESWPDAAPDLILLSEPAVGHDGRSRIGEIIAAANGAPVLLLTDCDSDDSAAASEPGVVGKFPSACGAAVLIAAIQLALAGGRFQISARPQATARRDKKPRRRGGLGPGDATSDKES